MRELKVFINSKQVGELSEENNKYVFGYDAEAKDIVSVTMPKRREVGLTIECILYFK